MSKKKMTCKVGLKLRLHRSKMMFLHKRICRRVSTICFLDVNEYFHMRFHDADSFSYFRQAK